MPANNQALNAYAIGIAVTGEAQLTKLGQTLSKLGRQIDTINRKMADAGKKGSAPSTTNRTTQANKRVTVSSDKRRKKVQADQAAERASMNATSSRLRVQSERFQKYNRKIQGASRLTKNEITDMFRRVALWSTGIGVLFGTLSKVKFIFGAVKDLEVQMVELKKVMDDDTPFKSVQNALFKTALSMSVSVDKASEIAKIWAQQGKSAAETMELTRAALIGVNSANLTAGQSVEFLTSTIKSFKLEATEAGKALDSVMAIQADFAITAQNLAKGLQVAGAITAQLGGDMNELFGMMTAVGEITRETGNVIGNSLKTQLARIQQPRTIAYLERLGIATRRLTDEGMVKRLSAFDIFKQISAQRQAGTLTQDQVLDIAIKIGGIRKFKDALVLIENFDVAIKSMHTGFLAYGEAGEASAKTQETLVRKIDKLNAAFVELGANIADLGNLEFLKGFVDSIAGLVTGLTSIARGDSFLGGVGSAAFQALPLAIIGGFSKFLGKKVMTNIRGTELRNLQEMANIGGTPIGRTQSQSLYTYFGKNAVNKDFAKIWGTEIKNLSKQAKQMGMSFGPAHKQMALMSATSKSLAGGMGGLNLSAQGLKNRLKLGGRAFWAGFAPGKLPTTSAYSQSSGGLGMTRMLTSIGGLVKTIGYSAAIILTIEGFIKAWKYLQSLAPKIVEFDGIIDPASEASKAFIDLSGTLVKVKEDAEKAEVSLGEFTGARSFIDKQLDLQPLAEEAGTALFYSMFDGMEKVVPEFNADLFKEFAKERKIASINLPDTDEGLEILYENISKFLKTGAISNRAHLKKYLMSLGIDEKDIPIEEATKKFQKAFRDFLKFEIAGDLAKAAKETNENLGEFLTEFEKGLDAAKITMRDITRSVTQAGSAFTTSLSTTTFKSALTSGGGLIDRAEQFVGAGPEAGTFVEEFSIGFRKNLKSISEAFKEADEEIDGKDLLQIFGIQDQELMTSAINKIFAKWKDISKKTDKLLPLDVVLGEYLDKNLGTFSGGAKLRSTTEETGGVNDPQLTLRNIRDLGRARIDASIKGIANQGLALIRSITGLERNLGNSLDAYSEAALDAAFALLKIPDLVFNATSKFVADMEKINIKSVLSDTLGTGTGNPAQEVLDAARGWITGTAELYPAIADNVRQQENVNERIKSAFTGNSAGVGEIVKLVEADIITQNTAYGRLDDLQKANNASTVQGAKQAISEARKVIGDLIKVRAEEALLKTDMDTAVRSWSDIVKKVKDVAGIDISGEIDIKKLFSEISEGNVDSINIKLGKWFDGLIDGAVEAIEAAELENLSNKMKGQTSQLLSYGSRLYRTGVDVTDAQIASIITTQQRLNEIDLNTQKIISDPEKDREEIRSAITLAEAEKKATVEMAALTLSLEQMAIEADKITGATDTARQAFTQLFADVSKFNVNTNSISYAVEDAFNQIANTRLEHVGEEMANSVLRGFDALTGSQFGEFILGEELKDPLDINTNALDNLSMSVDELRFSIAMMSGFGIGGKTGDDLFGNAGEFLDKVASPFDSERDFRKIGLPTMEDFLEMSSSSAFALPSSVGLNVPDIESFSTGGEFTKKTEKIAARLDQLSEVIGDGGEKIKLSWKDVVEGLGQIAGGVFGNLAADAAGKQGNAVNIGTSLGGAAGTQWLTGLMGSFAGPFGSILGGIVGGIFGRDKDYEEEKIENLKSIVENTAALIDIDRRIINAPTDFNLPAGAQGGSVQWTGDINISGGDPQETAAAVVSEVNKIFGRSTSTYNNVNDRLS